MIKEKAYAKVNLFLNVTGKRLDGYHDLEMVMASIDLFDVLTFELLKEKQIVIESNVKITQVMEENLVYKIAKSIQEDFDIQHGVKIYIKKNIPIAAGLAGGSADGAATLRGLNKLWKLKLSLDDNIKVIEPLEYLELLKLMKDSKLILSDSGGIQEEASILGVPCVTLRTTTERQITLHRNVNIIAGYNRNKIHRNPNNCTRE